MGRVFVVGLMLVAASWSPSLRAQVCYEWRTTIPEGNFGPYADDKVAACSAGYAATTRKNFFDSASDDRTVDKCRFNGIPPQNDFLGTYSSQVVECPVDCSQSQGGDAGIMEYDKGGSPVYFGNCAIQRSGPETCDETFGTCSAEFEYTGQDADNPTPEGEGVQGDGCVTSENGNRSCIRENDSGCGLVNGQQRCPDKESPPGCGEVTIAGQVHEVCGDANGLTSVDGFQAQQGQPDCLITENGAFCTADAGIPEGVPDTDADGTPDSPEFTQQSAGVAGGNTSTTNIYNRNGGVGAGGDNGTGTNGDGTNPGTGEGNGEGEGDGASCGGEGQPACEVDICPEGETCEGQFTGAGLGGVRTFGESVDHVVAAINDPDTGMGKLLTVGDDIPAGGACPVGSFEVFGNVFQIQSHCTLADQHYNAIRLAFLLAWSFIGIIIIAKV